MDRFVTGQLGTEIDAIAPDGSKIRLVQAVNGGSVALGTLPAGAVSAAVMHRTVEEIWFVLSGEAEMWRSADGVEQVDRITAGSSLTIPLGTAFQFRTAGSDPFCFLMFTMPPWPGADEAVAVVGKWKRLDG